MSKLYRSIGITMGLVLVGCAVFGTYHLQINWGRNDAQAKASRAVATPAYQFSFSGRSTIDEAQQPNQSESGDWWVESGGELKIRNGIGSTLEGSLPTDDPMRKQYARSLPVASDNGFHPQNVFEMLTRSEWQDSEQTMYAEVTGDNLFNPQNVNAWNGLSLLARYQDNDNYYYLGVRMDGGVVIKKKKDGVFTTLDSASLFPGRYDATINPNLIPKNQKIGLRSRIITNDDGSVSLQFYVDAKDNGSWKLVAEAVDTGNGGKPITAAGNGGVIADYMDVEFSNYQVNLLNANGDTAAQSNSNDSSADQGNTDGNSVSDSTTTQDTTTTGTKDTGDSADTNKDASSSDSSSDQNSQNSSDSYDAAVLSDQPAMFLAMNTPSSGSEADKSGNGNKGTYKGGAPSTAKLPNGDTAAEFNGSSEYLSVPSDPSLSIPTTHKLTWEAWIMPDSFNFSNPSEDGYIDWMGKCADYSPTCEWEARLYGNNTAEGRPDRLSAYVFNSGAGLGSGADWQPSSKLQAGKWIHVVAEYDTQSTPSSCSSSYPSTISIWVNGIKQDFGSHAPTGCMSQYKIKPSANDSPLNIGTMAMDTWFKGAIGKVAVYDHLLTPDEIANHYKAMTGNNPSGSCKDTCTAQGIM